MMKSLIHCLIGSFVLLQYVSAILYSNTPGGKSVTFSNKYDRLPWPINKATDLSNAVWHGVHCVAKIQECTTAVITNPSEFHHVEHCRQHVKDAIKFFEKNTNYSVNPIICDDIRDIFKDYKHILVLPMFGDFEYDGKEVADPDGRVAESGYSALLGRHPEIVGNDDVFNMIAAVNSGNIRTKAMNNYTLTKDEQKHMDEWHSDRTNRLASLGLYCLMGEGREAPISILKNIVAVPCAGHKA